jgi:hypothetical protein
MLPEAAIKRLRAAFRRNELAIYVGAGASKDSGLPTWYSLILSVYLNSLGIPGSDQRPWHLIQATGEQWFARSRVPMELAARALRASFRDSTTFRKWIGFGLYQRVQFDGHGYATRDIRSLIRRNPTLNAIVRLCRRTRVGDVGLRAVVNYNLDGLLEEALGSFAFQSVWKQTPVKSGVLPIYHVHGYLPVRDPFGEQSPKIGSSPDEIVLTEDQYHREAADPYSWANLVQLQAMSSSVGLTIGLSLSDPNMRRLLDVTKRASCRPEMFALLQKPDATELGESDLEDIKKRMREIANYYPRNLLPELDVSSEQWRQSVKQIWGKLERLNFRRQVSVLRELGVEPIWCRHAEIPFIAERIIGGARAPRHA